MKFNPTLPLALAFSVGAAGAVMATMPTPTQKTNSSTAYSQPSMSYSQPQASGVAHGQTPVSANQAQARTDQMPTPTAQTQQPGPATATPSMASGTAVNGNEQVRMAQRRLHAAGIYNGPEDGIMDPDTRAAIARYQEQNGLRRSEALDPATLASLDHSQTPAYGSTTPPATATPGGTSSAALNPDAGATGGNSGKSTAR